MFSVDLHSRKPIFEQIYDNLRDEIVSGVVNPDDRLPSVRDLSERLSVSPNTVMKAFRALEERGYVYSASGLGTFASPREKWLDNDRALTNATAMLRRAIMELSYCGKNSVQIIELTETVCWEAIQHD